jgi:formylglycine-generating enzyme required for sulfatase activity
MKFRLIPPGEFTIGSSPEEIKAAKPQLTTSYDEKRPDRADSEGPQQRITISKPFYLGLAEVTQSQYQTVTGVNPSHYQRGGEGADKVGDADRSNAPVELVSWLDTGVFCDRLSRDEGLASAYHTTPEMISLTGSGGYRLPTEAEWEYACRAGAETLYFSGDDEARLKEVAWTAANRQAFPQPVATRKANPFGLYDMHGNAWEWVHDSWRANTYELMTGAGALDPRCDLGFANWKVIRGGAYHYSTAEARSGCRDAYPADNRWHDTGFRVAVSVDAVRQKLVNAVP